MTRDAIDQQNRRFEEAFNERQFAALAGLYREGATVLPPGSPAVHGRQAIADFWQGAHASGIRRVALHTGEVESDGDLAYETSTATLTLDSGDSQHVKYVVVWRRHPGGPWQLAVDIWNS